MPPLLPPGWEDIGAKGLVVLFVLLIFAGWLIPKRSVDRRETQLENALRDALADRDNWRKSAQSLDAQNRDLIANGDLSVALLQSIRGLAQAKDGDGT